MQIPSFEERPVRRGPASGIRIPGPPNIPGIGPALSSLGGAITGIAVQELKEIEEAREIEQYSTGVSDATRELNELLYNIETSGAITHEDYMREFNLKSTEIKNRNLKQIREREAQRGYLRTMREKIDNYRIEVQKLQRTAQVDHMQAQTIINANKAIQSGDREWLRAIYAGSYKAKIMTRADTLEKIRRGIHQIDIAEVKNIIRGLGYEEGREWLMNKKNTPFLSDEERRAIDRDMVYEQNHRIELYNAQLKAEREETENKFFLLDLKNGLDIGMIASSNLSPGRKEHWRDYLIRKAKDAKTGKKSVSEITDPLIDAEALDRLHASDFDPDEYKEWILDRHGKGLKTADANKWIERANRKDKPTMEEKLAHDMISDFFDSVISSTDDDKEKRKLMVDAANIHLEVDTIIRERGLKGNDVYKLAENLIDKPKYNYLKNLTLKALIFPFLEPEEERKKKWEQEMQEEGRFLGIEEEYGMPVPELKEIVELKSFLKLFPAANEAYQKDKTKIRFFELDDGGTSFLFGGRYYRVVNGELRTFNQKTSRWEIAVTSPTDADYLRAYGKR